MASSMARRQDPLDRLVIFLAKRDGIDKLVKTFQYVAKLAHWRLAEHGRSGLADRAKRWEVSCGTSRKAFRTGRFLTGLNALRNPNPNPSPSALLAVLANGGEMVYFFFDHLLWLARIGFLDTHLATRMSFVSAFGESFGYVFFIISDLIAIARGVRAERRLLSSGARARAKARVRVRVSSGSASSASSASSSSSSSSSDVRVSKDSVSVARSKDADPTARNGDADPTADAAGSKDSDRVAASKDPDRVAGSRDPDRVAGSGDSNEAAAAAASEDSRIAGAELEKIRSQRVMATLAIAANVADLIIALADIEPNPFCCHTLTLGISGLVSAWSGWYRNWPAAQ